LRYCVGQEYRQHHDAIPNADNQRSLTLLIYLNEDFEGGETIFPKVGLRFRGRLGEALLFRNVASGQPDPLAVHIGMPVTAGIKYLASRWIRERPLKLTL
jgi:prolyl 4-hydroxylase